MTESQKLYYFRWHEDRLALRTKAILIWTHYLKVHRSDNHEEEPSQGISAGLSDEFLES